VRPESLRDSVDIAESLASEARGFGVRESAAFVLGDSRLEVKA
jgi:hypothetical protein